MQQPTAAVDLTEAFISSDTAVVGQQPARQRNTGARGCIESTENQSG